MAPAEPNQPNTIDDSCADGNSGTFHGDESNDRIRVFTNDGTTLATGKQVTDRSHRLGLEHEHLGLAGDLSSRRRHCRAPVWTAIWRCHQPAGAGQQVMSRTFTLPAGADQAIRAKFRFSSSAGACVRRQLQRPRRPGLRGRSVVAP